MKKRIAVLFGGRSPEHKVSLQSAAAVLEAMDPSRYEALPIGITQEGSWFRYTGDYQQIASGSWYEDAGHLTPVTVSLNPGNPGLLEQTETGWVPRDLDAAFPVLHGRYGEDGTVQGLFALAGVPLVGCGVLASALGMDKDRAHRIVRSAGVAAPRSFAVSRRDTPEQAAAWGEELGYPLFVKPLRGGSSLGISRVAAREGFPEALRLALAYDDCALLEEAIPGVELGCAVVGNDALTLGVPDEVELAGPLFDYEEKYTLKTAAIHVPARISPETAERVKAAAETVYRALDCRGFARVDLFLTDGGELVFNEVNTIPGFTAHSRFPRMLAAAGLSLAQVVDRVIELAVRE